MLGLGVMIGHSISSWFLCAGGGLALVVLGLLTIRRK